MRAKDLTGRRFGRLEVIQIADELFYPSKDGHRVKVTVWECRCDCGNKVNVRSGHLATGHTQSCGCKRSETASSAMRVDGRSKERLYRVWGGMMSRCYRAYTNGYQNYGGRGIKVCDEWHDYPKFREWAYSHGYDQYAKQGQCTLDRIDVNGDYEPDNCRWLPMSEQLKNKRGQEERHE